MNSIGGPAQLQGRRWLQRGERRQGGWRGCRERGCDGRRGQRDVGRGAEGEELHREARERRDRGVLEEAVALVPSHVEAALALGATKCSEQPSPENFRVFLDPVGHPFCLCA